VKNGNPEAKLAAIMASATNSENLHQKAVAEQRISAGKNISVTTTVGGLAAVIARSQQAAANIGSRRREHLPLAKTAKTWRKKAWQSASKGEQRRSAAVARRRWRKPASSEAKKHQ